MTPLIQCSALTKVYRMGDADVFALDGIDLTIEHNDYVAIIGPSGSGKSTMMNILGCLDTPSSGQFLLNGRDVAKMNDRELAATRNREIGFIFQSFNLLPRATALENVMRPLVYRGISRQERRERAREALALVGLEARVSHLPNELSGGQRQRVAIARALCGEPSLLLADEPTGNLDTATADEIIGLFDRLHRAGNTILLITHEPTIAARCKRAITLADGRIVDDRRREQVLAA
ncbi:putative ABC transport system ATP-binding protein [Sphingomonas kyeonggiensis]|uniref:ABC transporter ATP-binding protein n=1 Tax=Sphingomonas kyeonggiensis TaxID=1268553 RepID=UPI00277F0898|nr:ABC transporter ATP-binding protein [Sphingomonas kyeonggiensis]MDQ0248326.1 putative ABC transport system ATP-binding protein [Sphingomonas kyeonggiensis]